MNTERIVQFKFDYNTFDDINQTLVEPIAIPFDDDIEKLLNKITYNIESYNINLPELKNALEKFIREKNQEYFDDRDENLLKKLELGQIETEELIKNTEKWYKEELLQFADRIGPSDEDIFAQCFHRLVHSSSLPEILVKEKIYSKVIVDMITKMDSDIQQTQLESNVDQLDKKKFESELEAVKGHQKNEYKEWITSQVSKTFQECPVATPLGNRSSMFISQTPSMEESFTIHLGSQLKHMHNIRILSANITDLCSPLHADESLSGLNMALGLYSSSLCGVVVLTPSNQVHVNKNIMKNANMSTEFHFEQIDNQLEKISNDLKDLRNENLENSFPKLKTGDFFITRHSNLSQSHVIFHLITDESFNISSEINSRHPVLMGLRNVLKTASQHDITSLTIPALLRHEMSEDMTVPWCIRRAELVFKCAKGFMIESASWGGAELSTLQLLLPHDISEELFTTLAGMVSNVFRVANPKILVDNNK